MVNAELNAEIDSYISSKRRKPWFFRSVSSTSPRVTSPAEMVMIRKQQSPAPRPADVSGDFEIVTDEGEFEKVEEEFTRTAPSPQHFSAWVSGSVNTQKPSAAKGQQEAKGTGAPVRNVQEETRLQAANSDSDEPAKEYQEEVSAPPQEQSSFERELEGLEEEEEELEQEEAEVKKRETRVWSKMAALFSRQVPKEAERASEDAEQLREDLKVVAKIASQSMQKMLPTELEEFKRSAQYEQFVSILERNGLAKRTQQPQSQRASSDVVKGNDINIFKLGG